MRTLTYIFLACMTLAFTACEHYIDITPIV